MTIARPLPSSKPSARRAIAVLVAGVPAVAQAQAAVPPPTTAAPAPVRNAPDRFEIAAFDIVGVTRLDARVIEDAVYPFAGPDRAAADVEAARKAVEDAYKARGFESVVVDIPPQPNQSFVAGIVELRVSEAPIGRLRVTGSKYHALSIVEAQVPALREGTVPDFAAAQRQIAAANRFPDREITPSVKAGRIPGTIDVDLRVKDSLPLHASIDVNNDHNVGTSPLRVAGSVRYTNLWQVGHTLTASYLVAPEDRRQTEVISASYLAPLIGSRWTLLLYGYKSNSNVAALGGTQVLGNGYAIGSRAIYRLSGHLEQSLGVGFDYKDFKEDIFVPSADPTVPAGTIRTPIAYVPLVASYSVQGSTEHSAANLTITATAGLRGLGSNETSVQTRRFNAIGNFVHLNVEGDYTRAFGHDVSVALKIGGQLSDSPLVTNEQFGVGGLSTVRGYFQSEAVGDDGVTGSVELRSPSFAEVLGRRVDEARLFVFADGGFVSVRSPLPDQRDRSTLVSVGAGTRFQLLHHFKGDVAYGWALTRGSPTEVGDGQLTFSVKSEF